ncbi:hypothetical protein MRX96_015368 [Rhipicephalus microplus]
MIGAPESVGSTGLASSSVGMRPSASSCAWARRSATWAAITFWRSTVSRHFGLSHWRNLQKRLCPRMAMLRPWLRHRAHFGLRVVVVAVPLACEPWRRLPPPPPPDPRSLDGDLRVGLVLLLLRHGHCYLFGRRRLGQGHDTGVVPGCMVSG